ncbi:hypothetical protein C0993_001866, partial [Termitomyces sp. T159_Od127]
MLTPRSEDEDAPSALTRRISSLNLANRSSASSLVLSRSTNSLSSAPSRSSSGTSDYHTSLPSRKSSSASARPFTRSAPNHRISDDVDEFGNIPPTRLRINTLLESEEHSSPLAQGARLTREKSLPPLPRLSAIDTPRSLPRSIGALRRSSAGVSDGRARSGSTP